MLESVSSDALLFADDTKIYRQISSKEDALKLQEDIRKLEDWTKTWLLRFNADKWHVLSVEKLENILHAQRYEIADKKL